MSTARKLTLALVACLAWIATPVLAETDHGFSRLFVFGDSLSDPGNRFAITGETAHPPFSPIPDAAYGVGGHHFSNGRTWIEVLAQTMNLTEWAKPANRDPAFGNYAYGGARARAYAPTAPSFSDQVAQWIGNGNCTPGSAQAETLFVIQFGGNDLRDLLEAPANGLDPATIIPNALEAIAVNIGTLRFCGAQHFLIATVPDLGATPLVAPPLKPLVSGAAAQFNLFLELTLATYHGDINRGTVDLFDFVNTVQGFAKTDTPCLTFDVTEGAFCQDRDSYLFWDAIHPTKKAHETLAGIAYGNLPSID
jgi:outer membrane lipase/esterase